MNRKTMIVKQIFFFANTIEPSQHGILFIDKDMRRSVMLGNQSMLYSKGVIYNAATQA